ncbi:MAG: dTDP-4-dehydrorhamnose 3,5-epimerase [Bacillota bacterium]
MNVTETKLPGVKIIDPRVFTDTRGFFMETWSRARYMKAGLPDVFAQDNLSCSIRGVLRGLHFQHPSEQGKLVYVIQGEVFDVAVDIRVNSPTFGRWVGVILSGNNKRQLYIPEGFAHGYCVTSKTALFAYKCTDCYNPRAEGAIRWDDPDLGINWPNDQPILAEKDKICPRLSDIPLDRLPRYREIER